MVPNRISVMVQLARQARVPVSQGCGTSLRDSSREGGQSRGGNAVVLAPPPVLLLKVAQSSASLQPLDFCLHRHESPVRAHLKVSYRVKQAECNEEELEL